MAFYNFRRTLPINGTESSPQTEIGYIGKGIVHRIRIDFPRGCFGLVFVKIFIGGIQRWPSIQGQSFRGDGVVIDFIDFISVEHGPEEIKIEAWNEDDTFEHTIDVGIGVLPREVLLPEFSTRGIIAALRNLVIRPSGT